MTATSDPKHARDEFGVLGQPRFIPKLPLRHAGGSERLRAVSALLPALRERPNSWAAVMESEKPHAASNVVTSFRRGRFGPSTSWETAVRLNAETKRHVLYVRYIGPAVKR